MTRTAPQILEECYTETTKVQSQSHLLMFSLKVLGLTEQIHIKTVEF